MLLEYSAIPLAYIAGILSIVSPCVWPLVPIVMGSAQQSQKLGALSLALGLSVSFAFAGSLLTFFLVSFRIDPEFFRWIAAAMLILVGLILAIKPLADAINLKMSILSAKWQINTDAGGAIAGQFGVGLLLGLVWLPCVGPTLGAAIALASMGQELFKAFVVMFFFGVGTSAALLAAALFSKGLLRLSGIKMTQHVATFKRALGILLIILGIAVFSGLDKAVEAWSLKWLPEWATDF